MKIFQVLVMFVATLLSGCESYQVITDQDPAVDLTRYQTFGWGQILPVGTASPSAETMVEGVTTATGVDGSGVLSLDLQRLRKVSRHVLESKGYLFVGVEAADFQVFLASYSELRFQAKPLTSSFGYGRGWNPYLAFDDSTWEPYEGQVYQVDLVDTAKGVVVWSGRAKSRVIEGEATDVKIKQIEKQIMALLKGIPQKPKH